MENPAGGTNSTCDKIGTFGVFTDKYAGSHIINHFNVIPISFLAVISLENFNFSRWWPNLKQYGMVYKYSTFQKSR